jgi:hypothetical protein
MLFHLSNENFRESNTYNIPSYRFLDRPVNGNGNEVHPLSCIARTVRSRSVNVKEDAKYSKIISMLNTSVLISVRRTYYIIIRWIETEVLSLK